MALSPKGRIAHATVTHRGDTDPDSWMRYGYHLAEATALDPVVLPAPEATIPLERYVGEQMDGEHNG